ncbi:MAG: hypothetical protein JNJ54_04190 [Myxococcaceae bacterium]|nr:hypothetical protein [Myxococcaceae bacterium]
MTNAAAFAGAAFLQLMGAVLRALVLRARVRDSLVAPSSMFFALALLYASALGFAGVVLGSTLLVCARLLPRPVDAPARSLLPWGALAVVVALVLMRPWVPTHWDEFVWLAKARFEAHGFGAGVRASLDTAQHVIPAGYPPLWPAAVGWLSLGGDGLETHVAAASLLVCWCAAAAAEAWWPVLRRREAGLLALTVVAAAPLVWVHVRSVYVDLPVGLLTVALLGFLLTDRIAPACVLAVVLTGFKDEGVAHVLAATLGLFASRTVKRPVLPWLTPALLALVAAVTWRWLLHRHGVGVIDHAAHAPVVEWLPTLGRLLVHHVTDLPTWGVFWAVAVGALVSASMTPQVKALRWTFIAGLVFLVAALVTGPERVRVFAENGTLLNRMLMQSWPAAALLLVLRLNAPAGETSGTSPTRTAEPSSEK